MRAFITGGTGFIGRNLIKLLAEDGWEIHILTKSDQFSAAPLAEHVNIVSGDVLHPSEWEGRLAEIRPDLVIHMAALTPVRYSWERWREYMEVNYFGTVNLIQSLRSINPAPTAIIYSTPEVLSGRHRVDSLMDEWALTYPNSPYGISKLAAEAYAASQPWVKCIIVRPANTYDRSVLANMEEAKGYFVEKAIIGVLTGSRIDFDGPQDRIRTWMHISDHVSAIQLLADRVKSRADFPEKNTIYHIAPPNTTASCREIVNMIQEIVGRRVKTTWNNNPRPYDPFSLAISGSKFMRHFPAWRPLTLRQGLELAISNWRRVINA
ncbi:MAG: NAD(P)-dependent oxidoreductase [Nitrososphaerota archaeon]